MKRYRVNKRSDKKAFKKTASRTHKFNLTSEVRRGGLRF